MRRDDEEGLEDEGGGPKLDTMLDSVAEMCVPITAEVQSMASGHVPVKISKYLSCIAETAESMSRSSFGL